MLNPDFGFQFRHDCPPHFDRFWTIFNIIEAHSWMAKSWAMWWPKLTLANRYKFRWMIKFTDRKLRQDAKKFCIFRKGIKLKKHEIVDNLLSKISRFFRIMPENTAYLSKQQGRWDQLLAIHEWASIIPKKRRKGGVLLPETELCELTRIIRNSKKLSNQLKSAKDQEQIAHKL